MEYSIFLIPLLLSYLIGSIPFGLLLTKLTGHGDIRKIGSGNVGATNVLRTGNKFLAALTLILDILKGALFIIFLLMITGGHLQFWPVEDHGDFYSRPYDGDHWPLLAVGLFAVLGHCFPVWLKFKGGKGVATTLGVLLAAIPFTGVIACITWLASAFLFRISSLAALITMAIAPIITFVVFGPISSTINLLISLMVYMRHKENIKRLLKGEEPKIGKKKDQEKKDEDESGAPS